MKGNNSKPKVSIVIPIYNGSEYMGEAIDSALGQSYENIEVIVINDGSNDDGKTDEIALSYGNKIKYFRKENGGVATALNLGIKKMKGSYFSWLSHDDMYYPNKIEEQIKYISKHDDIIIYSDVEYIDKKSKVLWIDKYNIKENEKFIFNLMVHGPNGCSLLIPRECFDKVGYFDSNYRFTQDYRLWFLLAKKYKFFHIPFVLIKGRVHEYQDSERKKASADSERDDLYIWFMNNISKSEEVFLSDGSVGLFYSILLLKYNSWKLPGATKVAFQRLIRNIFNNSYLSYPRYIYNNIIYLKRKLLR